MTGQEMRSHDFSIKDLKTVTFWLIAANVLVFAADIIWSSAHPEAVPLRYQGCISYFDIIQYGEYYRLLTAMFLHFGFMHLLYNMVALFALGFQLEKTMGKLRYAVTYLFAGLFGNVFILRVEHFTGDYSYTVGASGAIIGLLGAFLVLTLNRNDGMDGLPLGRLLLCILLVFIPTDGNVSVSGHIGGFLGGILIAAIISFFFPRRDRRSPENSARF